MVWQASFTCIGTVVELHRCHVEADVFGAIFELRSRRCATIILFTGYR